MLTTAAALALMTMSQNPRTFLAEPLPLGSVKVNDKLWAPLIQKLHKTTADHEIHQCEITGRTSNFDKARETTPQEAEGYIFNDSDLYKIIEGVANLLALNPDPALQTKTQNIVNKIIAAQEPDGYLNTQKQILENGGKSSASEGRWKRIQWDHELYCAGHLYEAAVAWKDATGDDSLLKCAVKNADLVCATFNDKGNRNPPGHEEIEIGLLKLYHATGNAKYQDQARWFLKQRGKRDGRTEPDFGPYAQDHAPIEEQDEAVGHAVRAGYLYTAMTEAFMGTHETRVWAALNKLWHSVADTKLYVTGGIGATGNGEAFGAPYELPNMSAYQETCATISNAMWNQKMFQMEPNGRYIDIVERALYNSVLSGIGLDGKSFFYTNPLQSGGAKRPEWYGCACCPPNVLRTIPNVTTWMYAKGNTSDLYVNLYAQNTLNTTAPTGTPSSGTVPLTLNQTTDYPWNGDIKIDVNPEKPVQFNLRLRIPSWATGKPLPGDLYHSLDSKTKPIKLEVNGKSFPLEIDRGYATISRTWTKGDNVRLVLPFEPEFIQSHEKVEANKNRLAVTMGPVVYCAEFADQPEENVFGLVIDAKSALRAKFSPKMLGGVNIIETTAKTTVRTKNGIQAGKPTTLKLIPYYAWANRGQGQMAVWLPTSPSLAWPKPAPTIASTSKIEANAHNSLLALVDQMLPTASGDEEFPFVHWWPRKGALETVTFTFQKPETVSKTRVYWFDDTGRGECKIPESWRVQLLVDGKWIDAPSPSAYPAKLDQFCEVTFKPTKATALRLLVQTQKNWAGGIHEVEIE